MKMRKKNGKWVLLGVEWRPGGRAFDPAAWSLCSFDGDGGEGGGDGGTGEGGSAEFNIADLPEGARAHVEGIIKKNADFESQLNAAITAKKKADTQNIKLKDSLKSVDIDEYKRLQQLEEQMGDQEKDINERIKAREAAIKEVADKELAAKVKYYEGVLAENDIKYKQVQGSMERYMTDSHIEQAIADAGGKPNYLRLELKQFVRPNLEDGEYKLRVFDGEGNVRPGNSKGDPMTTSQLLEEYKAKEDWQEAFLPSGHSGTGARNNAATRRLGAQNGDMSKASPLDKVSHALETQRRVRA